MDHFTYKRGVLHAEDVPVPDIAGTIGTPFYCYSTATLTRHYRVIAKAFSAVPAVICFAVKANSNLAVLRTLGDLGSGADCVSAGEIRRALAAGVPANKIVFSGVGKTADEMRYALAQNIMQFNVESVEELTMLNSAARELKKKAPVALRVNPDVDAGTHHKISTGRKTDKFGIAWKDAPQAYRLAASLKGIAVTGISTHIGSQLTALEPFKAAFNRIVNLSEKLKKSGIEIRRLDLGGGLGIPYGKETPPPPAAYAKMAIAAVRHLGCELILEPGRLIAGNAGILVTRVILVKKTRACTFVVVDAAMNDLIRPALYDAYHEIVPVKKPSAATKNMRADVVGPVCETGDVFARERALPPVQPGNLLAIRSAGAYGAVMACTYNSRLLVPETMVHGKRYAVVRERQTYEAMLAQDSMPPWL